MRSPARAPAASNAPTAKASSARVTQWIAAARPARVRGADRARRRIEVGQGRLVEHELHRTPRDTRMRRLGERERAHHQQPLREGALRGRILEQRELGGGVAGRGVGDARDAEARQRCAHRREVGRLGRAEALAQPGVAR